MRPGKITGRTYHQHSEVREEKKIQQKTKKRPETWEFRKWWWYRSQRPRKSSKEKRMINRQMLLLGKVK